MHSSAVVKSYACGMDPQSQQMNKLLPFGQAIVLLRFSLEGSKRIDVVS